MFELSVAGTDVIQLKNLWKQAQSWSAECNLGRVLQDMREWMMAAGDHVCMTIEEPRMIAVQPPTTICPEPSPLHIYLLPYPRIQSIIHLGDRSYSSHWTP